MCPGLRFEFYTYGPFSATLMGDLDYTDSLGAVRVAPVPTGGYCIEPGDQSSAIQERAHDFLSEHRAAVDEVIGVFGKCSAARLELLGTVHYAFSHLSNDRPACIDGEIIYRYSG